MKLINDIKYIARDVYLNSICASRIVSKKVRFILYKLYGLNIETANISPSCFIGGNKLKIGKKTFINYNCFFDTSNYVIIGNNCEVAYGVTFCTSTHEFGEINKRAGKGYSKPITVKDGCWIGANSIVLPGVTIEEGTIIAAGTIVTADCEANSIYAGVPARKIKSI